MLNLFEGRSEKHLRDIRAMLAVSAAELIQPELEDWIARRGLETEWRAATTEKRWGRPRMFHLAS
jgi:hypothetical protein